MENKKSLQECIDILVDIQSKDNNYCNTREFESAIKRISDREEIDRELDNFKNQGNDIFVDFCLYFIKFTKLRREDRIDELSKMFDRNRFASFPLNRHIILLYKAVANDKVSLGMIREAQELANDDRLRHNIGIVHHYCLLVAEYYEGTRTNEIEKAFDDIKDDSSEVQKNDVNDALEKMVEIISQDKEYAKFHSTYGRLLSLNGEFDRGLVELNQAIKYEKGRDIQRGARIATYKIQKSSVEMMKMMSKINESSARFFQERKILQKETQDIKVNNLKFLSLFTAVLAFLTSGLAVFNETFDSDQLFVLLLAVFSLFAVLFGVLFLVFALNNKEKINVKINDLEMIIAVKMDEKKALNKRNDKDDFFDDISSIDKAISNYKTDLIHEKKRLSIYFKHNVVPAVALIIFGLLITVVVAVLVFCGII